MSMLKFAYSEQAVVDVFDENGSPQYNPESASAKAGGERFKNTVASAKAWMEKAAERKIIKKSADFMYVRTRAIGSLEKWGPNMNGDAFPMEELASSYQTFVGKGNFIDHKSDDITKIRGLVIDAHLNTDDHCVECLIAVDKKSHPQLARDIETGVVNSVSMGTRVGMSNCSVCNNVARTEKDYCTHISNYKGMKIGFLTNNAPHKFGKYAVHEVNHNLEFIELSWVAVPAFADAYVLEKIASYKKKNENDDSAISVLKDAIDDNAFGNKDEYVVSDAERELASFAASRTTSSSMNSIAEAAACRDTECDFDARKKHNSKVGDTMNGNNRTAGAGEMARVRIQREEVTFRTLSKDYLAKGSIIVDNKSHKWWATSPDKKTWHVSIDEAALGISATGQQELIRAIVEMIQNSVDSSDLIVAGVHGSIRTGWAQGGDDPLMKGGKDALEKAIAKGESPYDNKDLALSIGDVSKVEYKNYSTEAAKGPAGELGKPLAKKDEYMKSGEKDWENIHSASSKAIFKKAYLKFMIQEKQRDMLESLKKRS